MPLPRKAKKRTNTWYKRQCDIIFSQYIRSVGRCEKCGGTANLQCSHVLSRSILSLRCDPENAICLCYRCHIVGPDSWHHDPVSNSRWFESKWPGRYDNLIQKRNKITKVSWKDVYETMLPPKG